MTNNHVLVTPELIVYLLESYLETPRSSRHVEGDLTLAIDPQSWGDFILTAFIKEDE